MRNKNYSKTYARILKLFGQIDNLTFLVGTGCSLDTPSNIPTTRKIMDIIIDYSCITQETEIIKRMTNLRFESLIEVFRDAIDHNLRIIDFFEQFTSPNHQHIFLALMIKAGAYVLTTNFDFLIEKALLKVGCTKNQILPVITKQDFKSFPDPSIVMKEGKFPLYKIHGSTKNFITGLDTKESLITTIQALGSNKTDIDIFSIEPFKKPLFDNISDNRTLVVMGYSGSDDFDITPAIKKLVNLDKIVWLNYIEKKNKTTISSISSRTRDKDKLNNILKELKEKIHRVDIYRIDINTSDLITYLNQHYFNIKAEIEFKTQRMKSLKQWLHEEIPVHQNQIDTIKHFIPIKIHLDDDKFEAAERCAIEMQKCARNSGNAYLEGVALFFLGRIYRNIGDTYEDSEKKFLESEKILLDNQYMNNDYLYKGQIEYANVRANQGHYQAAIKKYEKTLQDMNAQHSKDYNNEIFATCYGYLGNAYRNLGKYSNSIKYYQLTLKKAKVIGNIRLQSICKFNLGLAYQGVGQFLKQKQNMEEAILIAEMISDERGYCKALGGTAITLRNLGQYKRAIKIHKEAIKRIKQTGATFIHSYMQADFGKTEIFHKKFKSARNLFKKALISIDKREHKLLLQTWNGYIALTYLFESNLKQAKKYIQKADRFKDDENVIGSRDFILLLDGIIKARNQESLQAKKSFMLAFKKAESKHTVEKNDFVAYITEIVSLIGRVLTSDSKNLYSMWNEELERLNFSCKKFLSYEAYREFELLCDTLIPLNRDFIIR